MHAHYVIHKDVKPANLVFDKQGYLRLTDFGISKRLQPTNFRQNSGTLGYIAPEVVARQNHGFVSDVFAVGIIVHEIMLGKRPYQTNNDRKYYQKQL